MDVSLVSPPSRSAIHYRPPLALMYLSSFLRREGIETEIVDYIAHPSDVEMRISEPAWVVERLKRSRPALVGITCYTPEFMEVMDLAASVKEALPDVSIVVGGTHPTLRPYDFIFSRSPVDYVVVGEGEITLNELTQQVLAGGSPIGLAGTACLSPEHNLEIGAPRPLVQDLDALPHLAFDLIDMHYYTMPNPYAVRGVPLSSFYISYGRGCPFNCTFCVSKQLREVAGPGKYVRYRSAQESVRELKTLKSRYGIDGFYIVDDTFSASQGRAEEFCDEMIASKLGLMWACTTRVSQVSEELLLKMKKAGCVQIDFGIESGSEACLERVKKEINLMQVRRAFNACRQIGVRTFANILVNIPGETEADLEKSVELLEELDPSICSINILTPYIGTDVYDDSCLDLKPEEYSILGGQPLDIIEDERFRFTEHRADLREFVNSNFRRFNPTGNFLKFLLSPRYIRQLIHSSRKIDYLRQVPEWYREYKKQRTSL